LLLPLFHLGAAGRSLTSGLNCTIIPASTATMGSKVAHGMSNFGLSSSAMGDSFLESRSCDHFCLMIHICAKRRVGCESSTSGCGDGEKFHCSPRGGASTFTEPLLILPLSGG
jgi:hypothetical protein